MEAISSVLTDLHFTEEEVEEAVTDLARLLYRDTEQWAQVRELLVAFALIKQRATSSFSCARKCSPVE